MFSPDNRIRTRSQRAVRPEQWTQVPVLVKIFKLLINELANAIDSNMAKDDDEVSIFGGFGFLWVMIEVKILETCRIY